jgi:hypothetical protein
MQAYQLSKETLTINVDSNTKVENMNKEDLPTLHTPINVRVAPTIVQRRS